MKHHLLAVASCLLLIVLPVFAEEREKPRFTAERVFDLEYAADPQISPDGKTIVYARRSMDRLKDAVVGDLWVIDIRTGDHRPLIDGEGTSSSVRWSPNGDRLVYLTATNDKPDLRILYLDTGKNFSLAQLDIAPGAPVWSPNGSGIAFSMFVPAETPAFAKPPKSPEGAEWSKPVVSLMIFSFGQMVPVI